MKASGWKIFGAFAVAVLLTACGGPVEFSSAPGTPAPSDEQRKLVGVWAFQKAAPASSIAGQSTRVEQMMAPAMILPLPDGRLSILYGFALHWVPAAATDGDNPTNGQAGAIWIKGTGYIVKLGGKDYLVFRRDAGKLDDYTAKSMTPGFNIFRLNFAGDDRVKIYSVNEHALKDLSRQRRFTVRRLAATGHVDGYKYVTITGPQITRILEAADSAKLFQGSGAEFQRAPQETTRQK